MKKIKIKYIVYACMLISIHILIALSNTMFENNMLFMLFAINLYSISYITIFFREAKTIELSKKRWLIWFLKKFDPFSGKDNPPCPKRSLYFFGTLVIIGGIIFNIIILTGNV